MRENFKLRKMKVGLVSVAITMLYIMTSGQAEASETNQNGVNAKTNTTESTSNSITNKNEMKITDSENGKNFVKLDPINPGDKKSQVLHYLIITFYYQSMEKCRFR